ncbi:hypothetical protein NBRC116592_07500 [Colwellia sp. KU-HH00111]|uniref:hypothetical protein n=1 Tax=Colwellia sp. KU-HH00111 TaxID=3127652 RepID=UPI003106B296
MIKFISAWLGICCTVFGVIFTFLRDEIPSEFVVLTVPQSLLLAVLGILLMYIGRPYLPALLSDFFDSDNASY